LKRAPSSARQERITPAASQEVLRSSDALPWSSDILSSRGERSLFVECLEQQISLIEMAALNPTDIRAMALMCKSY
jgi:hypothetical protein